MRFVSYLACATLVAQAINVDDDDDMTFFRGLSSHNASNTTVTTATTAAAISDDTTTGAPSSNTTTGAPSSNTTTGAPSPNGNHTDHAPLPPDGESEEDKAALMEKSGNLTEELKVARAEPVVAAATYSFANPFFCGINPTDASCTASDDSGASTNSTRRLQTVAEMNDAHNLFCGAFSYTSSFNLCDALGDQLVKLFKPSITGTVTAAQKTEALNLCVTGVTAAFQRQTGGTDCLVPDGAAATYEGVCYANLYLLNNYDKIKCTTGTCASNFAQTYPGVEACTKQVATTSKEQLANFETSTSIRVPAWASAGDGADAAALNTALMSVAATAEAASANMASGSTKAILQTALVLQAVVIKQQVPAVANSGTFNLTENMGIDQSAVDAMESAVVAAGGLSALQSNLGVVAASASADYAAPAGPMATFATAMVAVQTSVAEALDVQSGSGGGGSTGAAAVMSVSAAAGLISLLF